jgi:hypothetical protein
MSWTVCIGLLWWYRAFQWRVISVYVACAASSVFQLILQIPHSSVRQLKLRVSGVSGVLQHKGVVFTSRYSGSLILIQLCAGRPDAWQQWWNLCNSRPVFRNQCRQRRETSGCKCGIGSQQPFGLSPSRPHPHLFTTECSSRRVKLLERESTCLHARPTQTPSFQKMTDRFRRGEWSDREGDFSRLLRNAECLILRLYFMWTSTHV